MVNLTIDKTPPNYEIKVNVWSWCLKCGSQIELNSEKLGREGDTEKIKFTCENCENSMEIHISIGD